MNKKPTVLIADDNKLNLQLFTDLLTIKNIDVIGVSEGDQVLEVAKEVRPDLIISDIRLGQVSGIKIIKDIKNDPEISEIPIITITAYVTDEDRITLNDLGCSDYLSKPLSMEDFYSIVQKYIKI